jgi:hypothetical protein
MTEVNIKQTGLFHFFQAFIISKNHNFIVELGHKKLVRLVTSSGVSHFLKTRCHMLFTRALSHSLNRFPTVSFTDLDPW